MIVSNQHRPTVYVTLQQQIDGFISKRSPISHSMTINNRLLSLLSAIDALRCDYRQC